MPKKLPALLLAALLACGALAACQKTPSGGQTGGNTAADQTTAETTTEAPTLDPRPFPLPAKQQALLSAPPKAIQDANTLDQIGRAHV